MTSNALHPGNKHKDEDYISQSRMRTEVSMSEKESRAMWTVASRNVDFDETL